MRIWSATAIFETLVIAVRSHAVDRPSSCSFERCWMMKSVIWTPDANWISSQEIFMCIIKTIILIQVLKLFLKNNRIVICSFHEFLPEFVTRSRLMMPWSGGSVAYICPMVLLLAEGHPASKLNASFIDQTSKRLSQGLLGALKPSWLDVTQLISSLMIRPLDMASRKSSPHSHRSIEADRTLIM